MLVQEILFLRAPYRPNRTRDLLAVGNLLSAQVPPTNGAGTPPTWPLRDTQRGGDGSPGVSDSIYKTCLHRVAALVCSPFIIILAPLALI